MNIRMSSDEMEMQQVPDMATRAAVRRNPEIQFKYTFGERKIAMDGRPLSDFSDFEINMKPVPKANADDIRYIARMYRKLMMDPEVKAMQDKEKAMNFATAMIMFAVVLAAIFYLG